MSGERRPEGEGDPAPNRGTERPDDRDYGDSAGYGGGGAAIDYDEVLGTDEARRLDRPNPLDEVVQTGTDKGAGERSGGDPLAKPELTNPDATPGSGAMPDDPQGDVDPGVG